MPPENDAPAPLPKPSFASRALGAVTGFGRGFLTGAYTGVKELLKTPYYVGKAFSDWIGPNRNGIKIFAGLFVLTALSVLALATAPLTLAIIAGSAAAAGGLAVGAKCAMIGAEHGAQSWLAGGGCAGDGKWRSD